MPVYIKHNKEEAISAKESKSILENLEKELPPSEEGNILFTYDDVYEYSDITLASRWYHYKTVRARIHWTGIILSKVWIVVFSIAIGVILCRNLKKDISSYNYRVSNFEEINEYVRKQIAEDVFRQPTFIILLLSSFFGTGRQLFLMFEATLALGLFCFMNPEQRENILYWYIILLFYGTSWGIYCSSFL